MPDHDQRFKTILPELVRLFSEQLAAGFRCETVQWLPQEIFLDLFNGQKRTVDLLARVSTRQPLLDPRSDTGVANEIIIDLEVESRSSLERLRPQIYGYSEFLRRRYRLPVLSLGLLLNVALNGIGWDTYEDRQWGETLVGFRYGYVGLPGLDGLQHLRGDNILAVALSALMRMPREGRALLKAEGLRRIVTSSENDKRKRLLADCLETYFKLNEEESAELATIQNQEPYQEIHMFMDVWTKRG